MQQYINPNMQYPAQYMMPYGTQPQPAIQYGPQQPQAAAVNPQYQNTAPVNYFAPQAPQMPQAAQTTQAPQMAQAPAAMPENTPMPQQNSNLTPLAKDTVSLSNNAPSQVNNIAQTKNDPIKTAENLISNENNGQIPANNLDMAPLNESATNNSALNKNVAPQNAPLNLGVIDGPSDVSNMSKAPTNAQNGTLNKTNGAPGNEITKNEKMENTKLPKSKSENGSFSGKLSSGLQLGALGLSGVIILTTIIKLIKHIKK